MRWGCPDAVSPIRTPARSRGSVGIISSPGGAAFDHVQQSDVTELRSWQEPQQNNAETVIIPISSLQPGDSPRLTGENIDHIRALAESESILPPIIVHRATMRIIDGMHRFQAAKMSGERDIEVRFFDGDEADAFVVSVQANIGHGLPLSLADRTAAAERIVRSHPQWSDRMIASATGLAAKTVRGIRTRVAGEATQTQVRVGSDGRSRPVNGARGRQLASEFIRQNPHASLREVARAAGISPGTVRSVRERLLRGADPVVDTRIMDAKPAIPNQVGKADADSGDATERRLAEDYRWLLEKLSRDPSLRFNESGRTLLRLLNAQAVETGGLERMLNKIPPHLNEAVARLARRCSRIWDEIADRLEHRVHNG